MKRRIFRLFALSLDPTETCPYISNRCKDVKKTRSFYFQKKTKKSESLNDAFILFFLTPLNCVLLSPDCDVNVSLLRFYFANKPRWIPVANRYEGKKHFLEDVSRGCLAASSPDRGGTVRVALLRSAPPPPLSLSGRPKSRPLRLILRSGD